MNESEILFLMRSLFAGDIEQQNKSSLALQQCTFNVDNLQIFDSILKNIITDRSLLLVCLTSLRNLLRNRGILVPLPDIQDHVNYLLSVAFDISDKILIKDEVILNMFSEAISISYRLILEMQNTFPQPFVNLYKFYNVSYSHNVVMVDIMRSFINSLGVRMKHNSKDDYKALKRTFEKYLMFDFLECGFKLLLKEENMNKDLLIDLCLKMIIDTYNFGKDVSEAKMKKLNKRFEENYASKDIPLRLLDIFKNSKEPIAGNSLNVFYLFINIEERIFPRIAGSFTDYCLQISNGIVDLLECDSLDNCISLFLNQFIQIVNFSYFQKKEESEKFFLSVYNFTMNNAPKDLIKFWGYVGSQIELNQKLSQLLPNIFILYINTLVSNSSKVSKEIFDDYQESISFLQELWLIVTKSSMEAVHFVSDKIDNLTQQIFNAESFQEMIIYLGLADAYSQCFKSGKPGFDFMNIYKSYGYFLKHLLNYIIVTSPQRKDLLDNEPEFMCKTELVLINLGTTIKNNIIKQKMSYITFLEAELTKSREDIYHLFIDRFLTDLTFFTQYPFVLYQILLFVDEMCNQTQSTVFGSYANNNELLKKLANREIIFNFEGVDFPQLKKLLPLLNKIYARNVKNWDVFLSYFDNIFQSINSSNHADVFILFRQIYGIFPAIPVNNDIFYLYHWLMNQHFDDFIKCIKANSQVKEVIHAIIHLWLQVCKHNGKPFPEGSGDGIILFRANTKIILLLKETCNESEWLAMKIIYSCITGRYANFGIMNLYNDNSLQIVVNIFFNLLENWAIGEDEKKLLIITECITALVQIDFCKNVIQKNLIIIFEFLIQNLLLKNIEVWKKTCECLSSLMNYSISNNISLRPFLQQFLVLIDGLINLDFDDSKLLKATAEPLYLMWQNCSEAVTKVVNEICNAFESRFQKDVRKFFDDLFTYYPPEKQYDETFYTNIRVFQHSIKKYYIELANIPIFSPIFHRNEK